LLIFSSQITDLDVTGSPLKADFDPDEEFESSYTRLDGPVERRGPLLVGLEPLQARTILSKHNISPAVEEGEAWALCSPTDNLQVPASNSHHFHLNFNADTVLHCFGSGTASDPHSIGAFFQN
jgi:hypothetical protein